MYKYLHCFEMDMDVNLEHFSMGQKKESIYEFCFSYQYFSLLMDEPTNGLDIPGKSQFRKFMASGMTDNKTIVISTHQIRDIDKMLDSVMIMDESRVLLNESTVHICEKLCFKSDDRSLIDKALLPFLLLHGE